MGDGTQRRQPFSAPGLTSLTTYSGCKTFKARASSAVKKLPTGLEAASPLIRAEAVAAERDWPRVTSCAADVRCGDVPVPPPRAVAA